MIYSEKCDNPETMIILDPLTDKVYSQEEAEKASKEIRARLVNHCVLKGYRVMTTEEAWKCNNK